MSKRSNSSAVMLNSKIHIRSTYKSRTHSKHTANHIIFPFTRNRATDRKIRNCKLITSSSCCVHLSNFIVKICLCLIPIKLFISHPKRLNNMKNINFKRRNILLRTFGFNKQSRVLFICKTLNMTTLKLEIFKKFHIIVSKIILLLKPIQFKLLELQSAQPIQFLVNSLTKRSKIYTLRTNLKFPLCSIIRTLMQIKLLLSELIKISFSQIIDNMRMCQNICTIFNVNFICHF